jgi:hypothetical protein
MYFLILLFVIVALKLFFKYTNRKKEQFLLFNPKKLNKNTQENENNSEYQNIKKYYINKIKEKFKDIEEKKNSIISMKKETQNNIKNGNLALNNNNRNKRRLME